MRLLGLDIGSSSVKAAVLHGDRVLGKIVRAEFNTTYDGVRAEVNPDAVLKAVHESIRLLGSAVRSVDAIALSVMAPSWVAMDKRGRAITPIVTHQDRRSVAVAMELEKRIGKARHLKLAGNRPFPGGISSTTWAWFNQNARGVMLRADLVGHLNTFLHRQLTGARVTDLSNASFMGLFSTLDQSGWCDELMEVVGATEHQLPQLISADGIGGMVTRSAGGRFGLTHGTPVLVGMIDTGSAMLLTGAKPGQLLNTAGSTDVLALCTNRPRPHERLLTRALGMDREKWVQVSTIAASGSALNWAHNQLFAEMNDRQFQTLVKQLADRPMESSVAFAPHLAGDRMSIEQRQGAFTGLTLATTRQEMLSAVIESIAAASAARIDLLRSTKTPLNRNVVITGGVADGLSDLLHRDWPGQWNFRVEPDATLRGLAKLL